MRRLSTILEVRPCAGGGGGGGGSAGQARRGGAGQGRAVAAQSPEITVELFNIK